MRRIALFLICFCLMAVPALQAQVTTAQINGTVTDTSGAVIPKAQITASNPATGFSRSTQSNETGNYALALLPPGTYDIKVEIQGFQTVLQKGVALALGAQLTLHFTLQPGAITQIVEVTGEAPLVELTRSEIGGSVSPLEVKELPVLDRNFAGLAYLIPGVRPAEGYDPTKSRVGNFSLNGGDGRQVDINVDGADNKDNVVGGPIQNYTLEGIQEFNVITNHYSAESGRTLGAVVNVVSKSGTNEFHGSAFGLFQSSTFNRQRFDETRKPVFHRYHFGFSAGGPVIKDKLFAFGAYENKREPGSISVRPSAFTQLSLFPLAVPVSQLSRPYIDHLLTIRIDHRISDRQNMFYRYGRERWIFPNDQLGAPFVTDLSQTNSDTNNMHDFIVGHNYTISPTKVNSLSFHFQDFVNAILAAPGRTFTYPVAGGGTTTNPEIIFPGGAEIGQNVNVPQQTLIRKYQFRDDFAWTHGRHNMKFGANYIYIAKMRGFFFFGANGYQVTFFDDPSVILGNPATYPAGFATPGAVESLTFSGGNGETFYSRPHSLAFYYQDDFRVTPRLTLNLGLRWDVNMKMLPRQLTSSPTTTNRVVGIIRNVLAANPTTPAAQQGLQYLAGVFGDADKLGRTTTNWKEFQPRIGFAWDPTGSGKHVIRGGYGIAYDQIFQNLTLFAVQQSNPTLYQTVFDISNPAGPACVSGFLCTFQFGITPLPAPTFGLPDPNCPVGVVAVVPFDIACGARGRPDDPRMTDPYAQQWSLGWAYEFRPDWAFSVDYYHILSLHEPRVQNINPQLRPLCDATFPGSNPADPHCVRGVDTRFLDAVFAAVPSVQAGRLEEIRMIGTTNRSRFDSFNFVLRKRFSHNYMVQASYVLSWSRSWGGRPTSSYSGTAFAVAPQLQFRPEEYTASTFDERHRFVFSGHFVLPYGFEISPIFQAASARPFMFLAGDDLDGDGRSGLDRACVGSTIATPSNTTLGCQQLRNNSLRGDPLAQLDVRFAKAFRFKKERLTLRLIWEFYNLFDTNNSGNYFQEDSTASDFARPLGYFGEGGSGGAGFGPGTSGPLRSQFGFRFEW